MAYKENKYVLKKYRTELTKDDDQLFLGEEDEETGEAISPWAYENDHDEIMVFEASDQHYVHEEGLRAAKKKKMLQEQCYVTTLKVRKPVLRTHNYQMLVDILPASHLAGGWEYCVLGVSHCAPDYEHGTTHVRVYLTDVLLNQTLFNKLPLTTPPIDTEDSHTALVVITTPAWLMGA